MNQLFTIIGLLLCCTVFGQVNIKGKVLDASNNDPLVGVSVLEKGANNGVFTDIDGNFTLNVQEGATIIVSFVGYESQSIEVGTQRSLEIRLSSGLELEEVVVTALGIERAEKALGYAVQKIDGGQITTVRPDNLVNALSGRLAGVQINNGSSGIGSSSRIVIRGEASFTGQNQALFVVDGVPISNDLIANNAENLGASWQEVDYGNGAAEISADDIASINILKGPAATALYGARAASGVVVITTKTGRNTKGLGVSINSSVTWESPLTMHQYQNVYGQGTGGAFQYEDGINSGVNDGSIVSFGAKMEGQPVKQFDSPSTDVNGNPVRAGDVIARNGNPITATPFVANPDNVRNFYGTGATFINNIALSSGNENGHFRISYSNFDNKGIVPNTDLKRHGLSLSGGYQLNDKLSVKTFINYVNSSSSNRVATGYGSENLQYLFIWMGRQVNVDNLRNYWQAGQEGITQFNYNYAWMDNPYLTVFENTNAFDKNRILGNVSVNYDFTPKLRLTLRSGLDTYNDLRASRRAFSTQRFRNGAYREDDVFFRELNTDFLFSYKDGKGDFSYSASVGGNRMDQQVRYKSTEAGELSVPGIYNFENSKIPLVIQQEQYRKRINSLYALGQVGYKGYAYLDLTVRNDWSSTLPQGSNAYAYYSASVSTILSEFVPLPTAIDFLKLRLSVASVGNDTDPYNLNNTFVFGQPYGSTPTVSGARVLLNNQFRPERTNAFETGLDLRMYKNRFGIDLTYYRNLSKDQIIELPTPAGSGYTSRIVNGGEISNQGVEVVLTLAPVRTQAFEWNSFINFSHNISRVEQLPEGIEQYVTGYSRVYERSDRSVFYIAQEGGRLGDMYGTGLLQVEGQNVFSNGDPVKDPNLRLLGNYNPDFIVGWGNDFTYKGLHFGFLFDWRQGGVIVSRTLAIASTSGVLENTLEGRETGVIGEGLMNVGTSDAPEYVPNTVASPAQRFYGQFYDRDNEANALYDATYVKLREVRIGYTLPQKWIERIGFQSAAVNVIGRNLLLFTENPHFDPELNAMQGRNFAQGVEDMSYPSSRSVGVALNIKL